jgi:subtilisin family serine protease
MNAEVFRRALIGAASLLTALPAAATPPPDWQAPLALELPAPARQIRLAPGTEPADWAERVGLGQHRVVYRGGQGSILETAMTDADWQALAARACSDGTARCETTACQAIQLAGNVTPPEGSGAAAVQARLVQVPPEHAPVADEPTAEAARCRNPAALAVPDSAAAGRGADITLDIEIADGGSASGKATPEPGETPDPDAPTSSTGSATGAAAPQADTGFAFSVARGFDPAGGASLSAERVPADSSDWTLMVSAGCSEVTVPLDALEPAHVPGRITALVEAGSAAALSVAFGLNVVREIDLTSTDETLAVFAGADNVAAVAAALLLDPRVSAAQPEYVYRTSAEFGDAAGQPAAPVYSDPFAPLSYGPELTGVLGIHPSAQGTGQLVAVIDTGVDADHPDLAGRIRDTVDTTGRGFTAELHGTAVAGIIAANADNAEGSYGVAPTAELLAIKACQPVAPGGLRAKCWTSTLVKALDEAMDRDATVINMSLAGPPDDLVARYVKLAANQDRVIVAGSGNNGPNARPAHPAALAEVLAVTAVDVRERRYADANLGDYIDLAAPGVDIISPVPGGGYPPLSGTSMASAHVAGAVALLRELAPLLGRREVAALLAGSTRDLGDAGIDSAFGAGLMDICGTAQQATASAVTCAGPGDSHAP